MLKYILTRVITGILVVFLVATFTFFLARAMPGGPFTQDKVLPEAIIRNLNERYHLNDPLMKQYADYMLNVARFDFGPSFRYQTESVNDIIKRGFPVSATIGGLSLLLAILLGIPAGIVAALKQGKWQDNLSKILTTLMISIPGFVLASLLMYFFAYKLRWFPAALWGDPSQAVLPIITLTAYPLAYISKLMRTSTLEVMGNDYIRTAKAKGMKRVVVIYIHALKNALLPIVTVMGPMIASVFTGSLVVEKIFAIPGLGQHLTMAITNRDYTMIMGITVFYAMILTLCVIIVDIVYGLIDPRIKITGGKS